MKNYLDYFKEVDRTPWGALFYKLLWHQLNPYVHKGNKILDFGSGFGKTADHLAQISKVTAYEPNQEMLKIRYHSANYQQVTGNFTTFINQVKNKKFSLILIHNVLEYVPDIEKTISSLVPLLETNGKLSIVKHNRLGHVFARAVLNDDPKNALLEYEGAVAKSKNFGSINVYPNQQLIDILKKNELSIESIQGIRTTFGLSDNNQIKEETSWQEDMFKLELKLADDPIAKQVAFFNHVIANKLD
ncbi:class I SAM-dependent methyltransferase [Oenococcus sp. UCMA 17063]|nr:class I SAM-dependent methyltransferase [Oenococcus sp. UCMA 17063]